MATATPECIDAYIANFPKEVQLVLEILRKTIKEVAPEATETISYKMPAFNDHGALVYFAAYKNHIGLYAFPTAHEKFKEDLKAFKTSKGAVQFPLTTPLPLALIKKIVIFRVQENKTKALK
jgi:uncharacterized protein YdhG (YjbR/CyaY superfamily)